MYRSQKPTRLLRQVDHKPYASSDDHHEDPPPRVTQKPTRAAVSRRSEAESSMPTPPGTNSSFSSQKDAEPEVVNLEDEEDDDAGIWADPESSGDEGVVEKKVVDEVRGVGMGSGGFKTADVGCEKKKAEESSFRLPGSQESGKSKRGKKRDSPEDNKKTEGFLHVDPDWINGSQRPSKRQKKEGNDEVQRNIFVLPTKSNAAKGYGKHAVKAHEREKLKKTNSFQQTKVSPKKKSSGPGFRALDVGPGFDTGSEASSFAIPGALDDSTRDSGPGSSSSLSSARSTPDPDAIQILELPDPKPYKPMVECSYCNEEVDKFIREEFEDRYQTGRDLSSFAWRRRFCKFHKQQEAHIIWQDRSYPNIEWTDLERRMRKHDRFLVDVLNDRTHSHYRETLKGKVKPKAKSVKQAYGDAEASGSKPGASVGYYGPKGERMMIDHIITCLSDDIRKQAKKDKLVAASGVQGGVSGFVQAVLVPHLAELLIKEDMKLTGDWSVRAREIITESCEVGEILHPEVEDQTVEVEDDGDDD